MTKTPTTAPLLTLGGQSVTTPAAPASPDVFVRPLRTPKAADRHGWWWGTGRRKTAVARVRLRPAKAGKGDIMIECMREGGIVKGKKQKATVVTKNITTYFTELRDQVDSVEALKLTSLEGKLEIYVRMAGGGFMGQAGALRLAIARALIDYDPTTETILREHGLLTRDRRKVEQILIKHLNDGVVSRYSLSMPRAGATVFNSAGGTVSWHCRKTSRQNCCLALPRRMKPSF